MPATNGNAKEATSNDPLGKFEAAITKFTPVPRGDAPSIVDVIGDLRTQLAHVAETLEKLEGLFIRSSDHVSKSSAELLDAIRLFSR